ncbi:hypothetical protein FHS57_000324 [Runella defluvii]|uniref:Uncharacterized protein n=1 Tax=Runella defluvii TaxID=370973 RepID=A0A7W6ENK4_9BACT|nr:hypothetical protein [Runella defluvii]
MQASVFCKSLASQKKYKKICNHLVVYYICNQMVSFCLKL